jgi:hypothetical protein
MRLGFRQQSVKHEAMAQIKTDLELASFMSFFVFVVCGNPCRCFLRWVEYAVN